MMHPLFKILGLFLFVAAYLVFFVVYEYMLFKWVVWWWTELLRYRSVFTTAQAFWNFMWVAGSTIMLVPHFAWVPAYIFKELVYLFLERQRSKPYEARAFVY